MFNSRSDTNKNNIDNIDNNENINKINKNLPIYRDGIRLRKYNKNDEGFLRKNLEDLKGTFYSLSALTDENSIKLIIEKEKNTKRVRVGEFLISFIEDKENVDEYKYYTMVGIWIRKEDRNKSIGKNVVKLALDLLKKSETPRKVVAYVDRENIPSINILKENGFTKKFINPVYNFYGSTFVKELSNDE